jgi:sugar phosphate isomerase/epimerase
MAVELALTPDGRWDASVAEVLDAAAGAGFTSVGISGAAVDEAAAAAYEIRGLRCHEVLALLFEDDEEKVLASAAALAEAATVVHSPWVLGVFLAPITHDTTRLLARCAAIVADAGARLAVEFAPMGPVATIADALEVVAAAGGPDRAGVLVDTWHFFVGASTWDDLAAMPLDQIAYVQFDDALPPDPEHLMRETMKHRLLPGGGSFELDRFASTLLDRGWDGIVSVEVLSDELRRLPVDEFARRAYESTARHWR